MISPELLRRYDFFSCLSNDQLVILAMAGEEIGVEKGHYFFHEGDKLGNLFFVIDGEIDIAVRVPDRKIEQDVREHIMGNFVEEYVSVSSIMPGQLFGWSSIITPNVSTACARTVLPSRVIVLDCEELKRAFQNDWSFGYLMLQKISGVIRQRLRDMRVQSLAFVTT